MFGRPDPLAQGLGGSYFPLLINVNLVRDQKKCLQLAVAQTQPNPSVEIHRLASPRRYGHGSSKLGPGLSVSSLTGCWLLGVGRVASHQVEGRNRVGSLVPLCVVCRLLSSHRNKYRDQNTGVWWRLMDIECALAPSEMAFFLAHPIVRLFSQTSDC